MPKRIYPIEDTDVVSISGLVLSTSFKAFGISIGIFCSTQDDNGVSNLEKIYDRYSASDFNNDITFLTETAADVSRMKSLNQESLRSFIPKYDLFKPGTEVVIDTKDIHRNIPADNASFDRPVAIEPFMNKVLKDLIEDDNYTDEVAYNSGKLGLIDRNPGATVWVWMRSLGGGDYLNGELVDITPFVSSINISKERMTGNFSINLAFVTSDGHSMTDRSSVYDSLINKIDPTGTRTRNKSQFHKLISKNDIVFIRLSRLKNEEPIFRYGKGLGMDPHSIIGKVFDMIGLVDKTPDVFAGGSGLPNVSLVGDDLTKLLMEDGSSIYQNRYVSTDQISDQIELSSDIFRLWGKHTSMFQLQDQTIGKQLSFIIDYMTRTKICEGLFDINPNARNIKIDIGEPNSLVRSRVSGIWKIVDIGVDSTISGYTSFNSRIGNDYSNIATQLQQVCQEPFVELYTDTYRDKFHIMARRPPFDYDSVRFWSSSLTTMSINEFDIINDTLDYDQRAYSWYKFNPRFLSAAFDANFRWLFPAKYFPEYADIFGDKPYEVENPYINHEMIESNDSSAVLLGKRMVNAGIRDFKYIIESNAYLPFTRTGSITINGNRLFKRGMWVKHNGTGELFYIDSISHSMSISDSTEWITTLNVSRGMVIKDLFKYFNIINLPIPADGYQATTDNDLIQFLERVMLSWKVNLVNFNYFIKRLQNAIN